MKKLYLSVIIPAYNEAKRLPLTLIDIDKHLARRDFSYEIIVVDNCSIDGTKEVVKRFGAIIPNVRLIESECGKGAAIRKGMLEAKGDYRLFTDADNSTSIDHFDLMIPFLKKGFDVVIGSRDIKGSKMEPPQAWYRRLAGDIGNIIIQVVLLPGIWDTQCGFKCFSEKAALKVFPLQRLSGFGFDAEVLALAKAMGYKTKEIPVTWVNDPVSKVGIGVYIKVLFDVFRVRFWLLKDTYGIAAVGKISKKVDNL
ncbi:MAG: glycosyltransferase family 2 protein [Candidatus Colwellbacteria bacterium]|nr:glycosyltransferase family 2 protein [Candidatus Colwellbacteria bacterium]